MERPPSTELCVLSVHAHPDDEASKGAATMARYDAEGVRTVLVTCTGGEAGDILNPAADTDEVRRDLPAVRHRELDDAVRIIGYDELYLLGYRDSGMPDTEANAHPDTFGNADLDEATGRVVEIVRRERPQVIVGYARDRVYAHPDHVRVHEISVLAFERAGDPEWYPELGEPWQPLKLYYSNGFTRQRIRALHDWFVAQGDESPLAKWVEHMDERDAKAASEAEAGDDGHDDSLEVVTTTRIDVRDKIEVGRAALLAHRTQIPPDSFFFRVPLEVEQELHPWEEYVLARSLVDPGVAEGEYETDLFAGLRVAASS
jgi:mycothiol S-conjugate amidase